MWAGEPLDQLVAKGRRAGSAADTAARLENAKEAGAKAAMTRVAARVKTKAAVKPI